MILLYTGAEVSNKPQPNPSKSLGGLVSNTPLENDSLGNLFPAITRSTITSNRKEIRLIAFKNMTTATLTGVRIWSDVTNSSSKLTLAAVAASMDDCGNPVFEQVFNDQSIPFQATLDYHEGEANAIEVGDISAGAVIGIWIRREVDLTKFPNIVPPNPPVPPPPCPSGLCNDCEALAESLNKSGTVTDESIQLVIDYN